MNQGEVLSTRAIDWERLYPPLYTVGIDSRKDIPKRRESARDDFGWLLAVLGAHAALGFGMFYFHQLAGVHAMVVIGVGLWAATRMAPVFVAGVAAYIAGSEVLWRLLQAPVPYEIGKYLIIALFGISLARRGRNATWRPLALVYFLLLLPSTLITLGNSRLGPDEIRMRMSFNLSGPLALCMSVWFLSQLRLTTVSFRRILIAYIAPCVALAVATLIATYTAKDLVFTGESNLTTSGGFGPNQVSATLGIAAMFSLLCAIDRTSSVWSRLVAAAAVLILGTQSAMTFSRGGLYTAGLALLVGAPLLLSDRRMRRAFLGVLVFSVGVMTIAVIPHLESFTGGALQTRFTDTDPTNRGELILDDLRIWSEHPVLGVGPGGAKDNREGIGGSGHTEYSRLLAEHGAFGFLALLALSIMALQVLMIPGDRVSRGLRLTLLIASMLSMSTAAMRIALFAFMFGLANARFITARRSAGNSDWLPGIP